MAHAFNRLGTTWKVALGVVLGFIALNVIWLVVAGGLLLLSSGGHVCGEGARHVSCSGGHYAKAVRHTMPAEPPPTSGLPPSPTLPPK